MRSKSILPTNLLDWPRVANLLPDQRLILLWLWACPYLSCAGFGFIPLRPAAATLGLDPEALAGGLRTLQAAHLIIWDEETGEVFVLDWFRFHTFKGTGVRILENDIKKVQSEAIKIVIRSKSITCLPTATATSTSTVSCKQETAASAEPQPKTLPAVRKKMVMINSVETWNQEDRQQVEMLVAQHGQEKVENAAKTALEQGLQPLPSIVSKVLKGHQNANVKADFTRQPELAAAKAAFEAGGYYDFGGCEVASNRHN